MNPEIFKHIECHTGNDLETIGFESEFEDYYINFYGKIENGYKLIVESFGKFSMIKENSLEVSETSEKDLLAMQNIINAYHHYLVRNKTNETEEEFDGDYYSYYGVNEKDFY